MKKVKKKKYLCTVELYRKLSYFFLGRGENYEHTFNNQAKPWDQGRGIVSYESRLQKNGCKESSSEMETGKVGTGNDE